MARDVTKEPKVCCDGSAPEFKGHRNIAACFLDVAGQYPDYPALGIAAGDSVLSYRETAEAVKHFAYHLGLLDSRYRVGILSENRPEWPIAYLGVLAAGGMVVPIDPLLKKEELCRVFSEAALSRLCVSARLREIAEKASAGCDRRPDIIVIDEIPSLTGQPYSFRLTEDGDLPASLLFTSGTTGNVKKVVLTHGNILSDIKGFCQRVTLPPGSRFLSVLPLHHTLECTCDMIAPLVLGGSVYYVRELNSKEILNGFKVHRITHFISVPLIFEKLYHGIRNTVKKGPLPQRFMFNFLMGWSKPSMPSAA
ncbi:MAG: AMP-binding protein [candidate division Zixibacteria bacterium]|nr:AMP-binding protein [candidate division Zixibacteria bacterium]